MSKRHGGKKWFYSRGQSLYSKGYLFGEVSALTSGCVGKSAGAMRRGWLTQLLTPSAKKEII